MIRTLSSIGRMFVRHLFGEDIFISYSRADGIKYAVALAERLSALGFTCRLDIYDSEPSVEIPARLKRDLLHSYLLVVVGSEGAARSPAIDLEIREFLTTGRSLIVIAFGDAVAKARWFTLIAGLPQHKESGEALANGQPAAGIVDVVRNSYRYRRRNQRIRTVFWTTAAVIAILGAVGLVVLGKIGNEARDAAAQRDVAVQEVNAKREELEKSTRVLDQTRRDALAQQQRLNAATASLMTTESALRREQSRLDGQMELNEALRLAARLQERRNADDLQPGRDAVDALKAAMSFERQGRQSEAATVLIENLALLPRLRHVIPYESGSLAPAWSANGMLLTGGRDGIVRAWDVASGRQLAETHLGGAIGVMRSSLDGKRVLAISGPAPQAVAHVLEARTLEKIAETPCPNPSDRLTWAARGDKIVLTCDSSARILDVRTGQAETVSIGEYISQVALNPSADLLAASVNVGDNMDYQLRFYSLPEGKRNRNERACDSAYRIFALAPGGQRYASGCDFMSTSATTAAECEIELCDLTSGRLISRLPVQSRALLFFDQTGTRLASFEGGELKLWDAHDGRPTARWKLSATNRPQGAFTVDGRFIATVDDGWARLLETASGQDVAMYPLGRKVANLGVVEDGRYAVTIDENQAAIVVWELQTLRRRGGISYGGEIRRFTFSPDGKQLLTIGVAARGSDSEDARLWQWDTGRLGSTWEVGEEEKGVPDWARTWGNASRTPQEGSAGEALKASLLPEEATRARMYAFSGDGEYIAAGLAAGIKVWNIRTGQEQAHIRISGNPRAVGFSPDGKVVLAAVDGELFAWKWQLAGLRAETCSILRENLGAASWRDPAGSPQQWQALCRG